MDLSGSRIILKKVTHLNELQAFLLGISLTLVFSFVYLRCFTNCPSFLFSDELQKNEQELQVMIQETDNLLDKLAVTIQNNKAVLNKMASAEIKPEDASYRKSPSGDPN